VNFPKFILRSLNFKDFTLYRGESGINETAIMIYYKRLLKSLPERTETYGKSARLIGSGIQSIASQLPISSPATVIAITSERNDYGTMIYNC
jgi:hypothetical protein